MDCPRCSKPLTEVKVGDLLIDGCNRCGGVWFDSTGLAEIARTQAAHLKELDDFFTRTAKTRELKSRGSCPKCSVPLFEFEFAHSPGIKLDACPVCKGIWMDDGELKQMYNRIQEMHKAAEAAAEPQPASSHGPAMVDSTHAVVHAQPASDLRSKVRHASGFLSSVECAACGRPNPSVAFACWACGNRLNRERTKMCPRCDVALEIMSYFQVQIESCPTCCGLWLDKNDVGQLIARRPDELQTMDDKLRPQGTQISTHWDSENRLLCPDCCTPMAIRQVGQNSGLRADCCDKCSGIWLAHGKLKQISTFYAQKPGVGGRA
jgi:Zn-finger nucleic acid-binding protein